MRKLAATRATDNSATLHQLMAIFGWKDPKMAMRYTEKADRRRASIEAAHKLRRQNEIEILCPPLTIKGGQNRKKCSKNSTEL